MFWKGWKLFNWIRYWYYHNVTTSVKIITVGTDKHSADIQIDPNYSLGLPYDCFHTLTSPGWILQLFYSLDGNFVVQKYWLQSRVQKGKNCFHNLEFVDSHHTSPNLISLKIHWLGCVNKLHYSISFRLSLDGASP